MTAVEPGSISAVGKVNLSSTAFPLIPTVDAILVLGGGVPGSYNDPPIFVKERCDAAAIFFRRMRSEAENPSKAPAILTLSAGTAHMPQLLSPDGLPVWEATASAAYLIEKHRIPKENVYAETSSYDTISNAYFARTSFTEICGWRKLLIITNEFHMARSKAIFDWIFHAEDKLATSNTMDGYELYYLSCENIGLSELALEVRREHEARGEKNVHSKLSKRYPSLKNIFEFLTHHHDFFTADKLVERARGEARDADSNDRSSALKLSYGAKISRDDTNNGKSSSSVIIGSLALASLAFFVILMTKTSKANGKFHFK